MANILNHQSAVTTKIIIEGESGTGKTGALASLADAGYNLRILDYDNGLDILKDLLTAKGGKYGAESASRVEFITLTEKLKAQGGKVYPLAATVWQRSIDLMGNWKEGETSLGAIASWTSKEVLVIDTLTGLARGAYNFILSLNGQLMNPPTGYDYQRKVGQAQSLVETFLEMLTSNEIKCNVIVNSHISYQDEPGSVRASQEEALPQQGFPTSLGRALGPRVPRLFNSVLLTKKVGMQRKLLTSTSSNVNLKTSAPTRVKPEYSIETGLAEYFKAVRGEV